MFLKTIEDGIKGKYTGLSSALPKLMKVINNLQIETGEYHSIGAYKKTGKTKFINFLYILMPYLLNETINIDWIYFSLEMPLLKIQAQFASLIAYYRYNKRLSDAMILSKGDYTLSKEDKELIEHIYYTDLIKLLGEYDNNGILLKKGLIDFIDRPINPTGINKYIHNHFKARGKLIKKTIYTEINGIKKPKKSYSYIRTDGKQSIILIDHVGRVSIERNYTKKQNIDKLSEYILNLRNFYKGLYVLTSQFNRGISGISRLKFSGEVLQPTAEDWKDSGNIAEDADLLLALFNPASFKHLHNHLGYDLDKLQQTYRSLHILENRNGLGFLDEGLLFLGDVGHFSELPLPEKIKY